MQLDHYSTHFQKRTFPITLVCDDVTNAPNIGSLFRAADAFGVEQLVFCGDHIPIGRKMTKTSRATEKSVKYKIEDNAIEVVKNLKASGYFLIALEISTKSEALKDFKFPKEKSLGLIIGDENFGVSQEILDICDVVVHIDMFGQNSSMNVVQAASISLYEITKQLK